MENKYTIYAKNERIDQYQFIGQYKAKHEDEALNMASETEQWKQFLKAYGTDSKLYMAGCSYE